MLKQQECNLEKINILALETSCDETAAAVVQNGRHALSNALYSQVDIHAKYGGVVPEVASRNHVEKISIVVEQALEQAGLSLNQMHAIGVTYGPGLVGALLTGVSFAKAVAYARGLPLIPVNHMEGHIAANYISHKELKPPYVCLIASGGHTELVKVEAYGLFRILGRTRDDAAGEALDKIARVIGLPYPGGPNLQKLAENGDPYKYTFPKSFRGEEHLDFSFSGVKTAVINLLHKMEQKNLTWRPEDIAASFQKAVVEALVENTMKAVQRENSSKLALTGGVSANSILRQTLQQKCAGRINLYLPNLEFCTDNAAMIGSAAYYRMKRNIFADMDLNAEPALKLV